MATKKLCTKKDGSIGEKSSYAVLAGVKKNNTKTVCVKRGQENRNQLVERKRLKQKLGSIDDCVQAQ